MNGLRIILNEMSSISRERSGLRTSIWFLGKSTDNKEGKHPNARIRLYINGRELYIKLDPKTIDLCSPMPTSDFKKGEVSVVMNQVEDSWRLNKQLISDYYNNVITWTQFKSLYKRLGV